MLLIVPTALEICASPELLAGLPCAQTTPGHARLRVANVASRHVLRRSGPCQRHRIASLIGIPELYFSIAERTIFSLYEVLPGIDVAFTGRLATSTPSPRIQSYNCSRKRENNARSEERRVGKEC